MAACTDKILVGALSLVIAPVMSPFLPKSARSIEINWSGDGPTWKLRRPMFLGLIVSALKPRAVKLAKVASTAAVEPFG